MNNTPYCVIRSLSNPYVQGVFPRQLHVIYLTQNRIELLKSTFKKIP